MWVARRAWAALLPAALTLGCSDSHPAAKVAETVSMTGTDRAGTLSVSALGVSGWHDERFHYLPALSVTAASTGRAVVVHRVDFTVDEAGTRHLLKGVQYSAAPRVQPGRTVDLVPTDDSADRTEITSASALTSISATVFFTDEQGQTGLVSTAAGVPTISDRLPEASLVIRRFTVERHSRARGFSYHPELTLAETSGLGRASIKKIAFELLDVGTPGQIPPIWNAAEVSRGQAITLATPEIRHGAEVSRVLVTISFVDDAGRGGVVSAIGTVSR